RATSPPSKTWPCSIASRRATKSNYALTHEVAHRDRGARRKRRSARSTTARAARAAGEKDAGRARPEASVRAHSVLLLRDRQSARQRRQSRSHQRHRERVAAGDDAVAARAGAHQLLVTCGGAR